MLVTFPDAMLHCIFSGTSQLSYIRLLSTLQPLYDQHQVFSLTSLLWQPYVHPVLRMVVHEVFTWLIADFSHILRQIMQVVFVDIT